MKRDYDAELVEVATTYHATVGSGSSDEVAEVVRAQRPMVYVGSGGALAVARLAADLHVRSTGELAVAMTPLEAATAPLSPGTGVVLFSARGRNPDAALAISSARLRGSLHLGVVSARARADLPPALASLDVRLATVSSPPDGFLATNSLMAMATAVCLAHDAELPEELPAFKLDPPRALRSSALVLTGPGTAAVGVDLEARLVETGLATVQLADYRNLAHGRHVGLMRNKETMTVVSVIEAGSAALAERTLGLLPPSIDSLQMRSELSWPASVLDLLVQSMSLTAATGHDQAVNPGGPGVPVFGRRLYHLSTAKLLGSRPPDPVTRKLGLGYGSARSAFEAALAHWVQAMRSVTVSAVLLDYDGTCCPTWDRYRPPPVDVQHQIVRLLRGGVAVAFATGRGKSLHDTTRRWLPEAFWPEVAVGLYNGTCLLWLSEDPPDSASCEGFLAEAANRLENLAPTDWLVVERRRTQVSVTTANGRMSGIDLLPLVRSVLERPPAVDCKAFASGHSVDVVAHDAGKVAVLDMVSEQVSGDVIVIGDQGQVDGNDFEMLAATPQSLSVDLCSVDPTRCWNLDRRGLRGPELLVRYLKAVQLRRSGARFVWKEA